LASRDRDRGMTRRILILGATSAIAQAYARRRAIEGAALVLIARHQDRLATVANDLLARGAVAAEAIVLDLAAMDEIERSAQMIRSRFPDAHEIVICYGALGDQSACERDIGHARSILDTNFTSAALWTLALLAERNPKTPLSVVVIGSVAGDRGRAGNFVYGAAKGGLDVFLEGLRQKYDGSEIRIITVKPGWVDSPMTAHLVKRGPLWSSPDRVAFDIHRAVERGRRVVYSPPYWRAIMIVISHLPWFMFKRLKL
jgi:short-subunit dehydrogenase